jgi:hypothetical protein
MPPKPPTNNKTKTVPGLGNTPGAIPRMDSAEMKRVRDSFRADGDEPVPESSRESRPRLRDSVRREDPDDAPIQSTESVTPNPPRSTPGTPKATTPRPVSPKASKSPSAPSWETEAKTATRHRERSGHPPVTVDNVGATAVNLARKSIRESAPKLVASRGMIAKAPIDTRAAFVLSLVDGRNTMDAIVDMSGMVDTEVKTILERLARLGLISLP